MILSFSASAEPANMLFYYAPAFNILLSFYLSAEFANTFLWEIFGIPADMLSNLTLFYPLSIIGQIDWYAWLTFRSLANTCPRIIVCWFLCQHIFWHAWWDPKLQHGGYWWSIRSQWTQLRPFWWKQAQGVPFDESKLKEDQQKEYLELVERFKRECLKSYSVTRSGDVIKKFNLPSSHWQRRNVTTRW